MQNESYEVNVCGEGGEFETLCIDSPIYAHKLELVESEHCVYFDDPFAPVVGLNVLDWKTQLKPGLRQLAQAFDGVEGFSLMLVDGALQDQTGPAASGAGSDGCLAATTSASIHCKTQSACTDHATFVASMVASSDTAASLQEQTRAVLAAAQQECQRLGCKLADAAFVYLQVADMACFAEVNNVYKDFFPSHMPPSRSCVQCRLPQGCLVALVARILPASHAAACSGQRHIRDTLHVQSLSFWAPLCIGPYCQANSLGSEVLVAGQIALEPHTMQLLEPSFAEQLQLAARNARRVLVAMGADWLSCSALLVYVSVDAISSEMTPELAWKQAYDVIAQQIENGVASKLPKLQLPSTDEQQEQLQELPWQLTDLGDSCLFDADQPASELWQRGDYHRNGFCEKGVPPFALVVVPALPRGALVEFEPAAVKMACTGDWTRTCGDDFHVSTGPNSETLHTAWCTGGQPESSIPPAYSGLLRTYSVGCLAVKDSSSETAPLCCVETQVEGIVAPTGKSVTRLLLFQGTTRAP